MTDGASKGRGLEIRTKGGMRFEMNGRVKRATHVAAFLETLCHRSVRGYVAPLLLLHLSKFARDMHANMRSTSLPRGKEA